MVTSATLPPDTVLDAEGRVKIPQAGAPRATQAGASSFGNGAFNGAWEPGLDTAVSYGPGAAERISGTHLLFNLHYQANGHETTDKTRVGIWLQKGPVTRDERRPCEPGSNIVETRTPQNGTPRSARDSAAGREDRAEHSPVQRTIATAVLPFGREMVPAVSHVRCLRGK
jgi:hypothetical protein